MVHFTYLASRVSLPEASVVMMWLRDEVPRCAVVRALALALVGIVSAPSIRGRPSLSSVAVAWPDNSSRSLGIA
jgi:hypothetical protein